MTKSHTASNGHKIDNDISEDQLSQLQEILRKVFVALVSSADSNSQMLDLPLGQLRCLRRIIEQDGCKLVDLARLTNLSLPNASRLVDRLVRKNLVTRLTDPSDRRAIRLHATSEARSMMESINAQRLLHMKDATRALTPSQIDDIVSRLETLLTAVEQAKQS